VGVILYWFLFSIAFVVVAFTLFVLGFVSFFVFCLIFAGLAFCQWYFEVSFSSSL